MKRISWTSQAFTDLESILNFYARDSEVYARRIGERINAAIERLEAFPRSGRVVPELGREDVREVLPAPFRVVYRVLDDEVFILTVFHAARSFPEIKF